MRENLRAARLVLRYVFRADPARAVLSVTLSLAVLCGTLLSAFTLKVLADAVVTRHERDLVVAAFLVVGFSAALVAGNFGALSIGMRLREKATLYFDTHMAELAAGIHHLEHHERADYQNELSILQQNHQQLAGIQEAVVSQLGTILRLGIAVTVLARLQPLLVLLPLAGIPSLVFTVRVNRERHRVQDLVAPRRRLVLRLFTIGTTRDAAKEIRLYDTGEELLARSDAERAAIYRLEDAADRQAALLGSVGWLIFGLGFVAAMALVAREAAAGRATPGDVVLAFSLAGSINYGVSGLAGSAGWLAQNLKTGKRLAWLEDLAAEAAVRARPREPAPMPVALRDGIRFEGVSFAYPGTAAVVLHGVDLFLPAGSTVAVVGDNGAGKTTLVKLLCRFYDPTAGRITVDGVDLREFDVADWRARQSGCFQDFARMELVAREVVGVGDVARLDDEGAVSVALERAHAADVPATLPGGLGAQLGRSFEGGVEPSTGQWQKLALGRAMMRDEPLLLVLDEPTASLDATTEHALFERYAGAAARTAGQSGAITILVSHRFSTVRMADLIVVVEGGRVTEVGGHDELVASGGAYAELYGLQARAYR